MNRQNEKCGTIKINSKIVKHLIGIDGRKIKEIKRESGARIHILTEADSKGQTKVEIKSNTQRSVQHAITLIRTFQDQYEADISTGNFRGEIEKEGASELPPSTSKEGKPGLPERKLSELKLRDDRNWDSVSESSEDDVSNGVATSPPASSLNPPNNSKIFTEAHHGEFEATVRIPFESLPHFFGKDGWRIKEIRHDTSTWIYPLDEHNSGGKDWKPVADMQGQITFVVKGKGKQNVQRAVFKINGFKASFKRGKLSGPALPKNKYEFDDEPTWKFDISGLAEKPPRSRTSSENN